MDNIFSFKANKNNVLEKGIEIDTARDRYSDKYMAVINSRIKDARLIGDIVGFFTMEEYSKTKFAEDTEDIFEIWEGWEVIDNVGRLGIYG
jgi:hypothetical protein